MTTVSAQAQARAVPPAALCLVSGDLFFVGTVPSETRKNLCQVMRVSKCK